MENLNGKEVESMMLHQKVWFRLIIKSRRYFLLRKLLTLHINKKNLCCLQVKDMEQRLKERQRIESVSLQEKVRVLLIKNPLK